MSTIPDRHITLRDGRGVTLRTGRPSDAARCLHYIDRLLPDCPYLAMAPGEFNMTVDQERVWLKDHLDGFTKLVILAEAAGEVVALSSFDGHDGRRRMAHTGMLGISMLTPWQGCGLGTAIMQALIDWAVAHPALERIGLAVFEGNEPAIALYRKMGFVEEGRLKRAVKLDDGRRVDDILMGRFVK